MNNTKKTPRNSAEKEPLKIFFYHLNTDNDASNRRLQAGTSKFDGDEGMFDTFLEALEIIFGLLYVTFVSIIT